MQTRNDLTKHVLYVWKEYRQSCFARYSLLGACGVYSISLTIYAAFWIKDCLYYMTDLEDFPPHVMIRAGVTAGFAEVRTFLYSR